MKFYDLNRNCIGLSDWTNSYKPFYFLGGPTFGKRICRRNQASPFIENIIIKILNPTYQINHDDIQLILAWKVGAIDHAKSIDKIFYKPGWLENYSYASSYGSKSLEVAIQQIKDNLNELLNNTAETLYSEFTQSGRYPGIGNVYAITLIYFFTKMKFPIIDKYAFCAAKAIINEIKPNNRFKDRLINWDTYQEYLEYLRNLFGTYSIDRSTDQALWCYGHWFNENSSKNSACDSNCG